MSDSDDTKSYDRGVGSSKTQHFFRDRKLHAFVGNDLVYFVSPVPAPDSDEVAIPNVSEIVGQYLREVMELSSAKGSHYTTDSGVKCAVVTMSESDCDIFLEARPALVWLDKDELEGLKKKVEDAKNPQHKADASSAKHDDTIEPSKDPRKQR